MLCTECCGSHFQISFHLEVGFTCLGLYTDQVRFIRHILMDPSCGLDLVLVKGSIHINNSAESDVKDANMYQIYRCNFIWQ